MRKTQLLNALRRMALYTLALVLAISAIWIASPVQEAQASGQAVVDVAMSKKGKTGAQLGYNFDWCAAFVADCARQAGEGAAIPYKTFVADMYSTMTGMGCERISAGDVKAGDLVFYKKSSGFAHVALMINKTESIHGNVNGYGDPWYRNSSVWTGPYTGYGGYTEAIFIRPRYGEIAAEDHFTSIYVNDITETNATIHADISLQKLSSCGFYFGTDANNMTKKTENVNNTNIENIWYGLNKWGYTLKPGTTYYYKFWYTTSSGATYTSKTYSFKTKGTSGPTPTPTPTPDPFSQIGQVAADVILDVLKENEYFKKIEATDITETNATIKAFIELQSIRECGFYFGTDPNNLAEKHETANMQAELIFYNLNKWGYTLKPGTTYYYKFWYSDKNGTRRTCNRLYSFKTNGSSAVDPLSAAAEVAQKAAEIVRDSLNSHLSATASSMDADGIFTVTLGFLGNPGIAALKIASDFAAKGLTLEGVEAIGIASGAVNTSSTASDILVAAGSNMTGDGNLLRLTFKSPTRAAVDLSFDLAEGSKTDNAPVAAYGASVSIAAGPTPTPTPTPTPVPATPAPTPKPARVPGDANGDGEFELDDIMLMIDYYVGLAGADSIFLSNCDLDNDGIQCDLSDIMLAIDYYCQ